jgi:hypothetical protein
LTLRKEKKRKKKSLILLDGHKVTLTMHKVKGCFSVVSRKGILTNKAERVATNTTNMVTSLRQHHRSVAVSTSSQISTSLQNPKSLIHPSSLTITVSCTLIWVLSARNADCSQAFTAVEHGERRFDDGSMRAVRSGTLEKVWKRSKKAFLDTLEIIFQLLS